VTLARVSPGVPGGPARWRRPPLVGQTLIAGGRDRTVPAAGLGSAALLAAVIQVPGVSQFFGCTPLGPVAWSIALGSAAAASVAGAAVIPRLAPESG
jgi:cation-transporting P-type ATPase I